MSDDIITPDDEEVESLPDNETSGHEEHPNVTGPLDTADSVVRHQLRGMYRNWFLDYASYVILERLSLT